MHHGVNIMCHPAAVTCCSEPSNIRSAHTTRRHQCASCHFHASCHRLASRYLVGFCLRNLPQSKEIFKDVLARFLLVGRKIQNQTIEQTIEQATLVGDVALEGQPSTPAPVPLLEPPSSRALQPGLRHFSPLPQVRSAAAFECFIHILPSGVCSQCDGAQIADPTQLTVHAAGSSSNRAGAPGKKWTQIRA